MFDIHVFRLKLTSGTQKDGNLQLSCLEYDFLNFIRLNTFHYIQFLQFFWYYTQLKNFKITSCKFSLGLLYVYQDKTVHRGLPLMIVAEGRSHTHEIKR